MAEPTVRLTANIPIPVDAQLQAHLAFLRATGSAPPITVTAFLVRAIQGQIAREQGL